MNKITSISCIRFISFMMIIICHILQGLGNELAFWFNLGVQIFFFMSGYLYGNKKIKNYSNFFKDKLEKILLPLSILVIIMAIMEKVFFDVSYSKELYLANILGYGGFYGTLESLGHIWFVSYILLCYLITPILDKLIKDNDKKVRNFVIILLLLISFSIFKVTPIKVAWICNYILGYFYASSCKNYNTRKVFVLVLVIMTVFILPISLILKYDLVSNIPRLFIKYRVLICGFEHVFLGSLLFILLKYIFDKIKIKYNVILKFSDKYSYYIYLVHLIFILDYFSLLHFTNYLVINIILIFIMSIISALILFYLCKMIIMLIKLLYFKKINYIISMESGSENEKK